MFSHWTFVREGSGPSWAKIDADEARGVGSLGAGGVALHRGGMLRRAARRACERRSGAHDPEADRPQGRCAAGWQGDADRNPDGRRQAARRQGDRVPGGRCTRGPGDHELEGEGEADRHARRPDHVHGDLHAGRPRRRSVRTVAEQRAFARTFGAPHRRRRQLPTGGPARGRHPGLTRAHPRQARARTRPARRSRSPSSARAAGCSARSSR